MKNLFFSKTDLKYILRLMAKKPGFTLLSILVLAGGLGVSIIGFTISYTMFYKPIPIANGDSIYHICAGPKDQGCRPLGEFDFAQFRDDITTMENVGMYRQPRVNIDYRGTHIADRAIKTEWNMFQLTQTNALLGRTLQAYDQEANAEPVVVFGYRYWQLHFNGEESAIGNTVNINGTPTRIVGIMPEDYLFPWAAQVWIPITPSNLNPLDNGFVQISTFGLLREGETEESADAEIARLMARTRQLYPREFTDSYNTPAELLAQLDTGHIGNFASSEFSTMLRFVMMGVIGTLTGFIFLLACINVGTLLLARTNERLKDISVRVALGAPRNRLVVQIMGESIAISIIGGVLAVLFSGVLMEFINTTLSSIGDGSAMAFWQKFHVDRSTLVGVVLFIIFTVLLTSAIPCWRIINGDFNAVMHDGTRGAAGLKAGRFSKSLVVTAITIITLLLFLGTAVAAFSLNVGRNISEMGASNVVAAQPELDLTRYDRSQHQQFYRTLSNTLQQDPSIDTVLIRGRLGSSSIEREEIASLSASDVANNFAAADIVSISGEFETLDARLLEGRLPNEFDTTDSLQVAVINRALADRLWPNQSAIDQGLRVVVDGQESANPWRRIVGVVSNGNLVDESQLILGNLDTVYLPLSQAEPTNAVVFVKVNEAADNPLSNASVVLSQSILALEPSLDFVRVIDLQEQATPIIQILRLAVNVAIASSAFSFLVAIAGIFGLTQNSIRLSTQEIGTRRALGATDTRISRTFFVRGGKQVLLGFLFAMLLAFPFTYVMVLALGWGFVGTTAWAVITAIALLYATVLSAIFYPIRQVLLMEPSEALRYE